MMTSKPEYLYLHVPFCRTICHYCDFAHSVYRKENARKWLDALAKEIKAVNIDPELKTIYIGGGTPTALAYEELKELLELLDPYRKAVQEYTVEINPETLDEEKAALLAAHGVNRASIGFQTGDEGLLKLMGRHHTARQVKETMDLLEQNGIDNVSLDLMYSLPGQTMDSLKESLETAVSMKPKHLSLYSLTIEPETVFGKKGYEHLDEDTEADMYESIRDTLPRHGFAQYEISNFSLPGYESKHNSAYWDYRDFYGIGCGASGKEGNVRYDHPKKLKDYLADPLHREETVLSEAEEMFETVMMGMRFKKGMDLRLFEERFGRSFFMVYGDAYASLKEKGLIGSGETRVYASEKGYEILNTVLEEFLPDEY